MLILCLEESINGVVIRGPILYGRSGSFVASYIFDAAHAASKTKEGIFETFAKDDTRWQTIHADDMGELYVRVVERVRKRFKPGELENRIEVLMSRV